MLKFATVIFVSLASTSAFAAGSKATPKAKKATQTESVPAGQEAAQDSATTAVKVNDESTKSKERSSEHLSEVSSKPGLKYSLTGTFPSGGSAPLVNSVGGRMMLDANSAISAQLVASVNTDNAKDRSIFGIAGKFQSFFGQQDNRARPYLAGSLYIWKPGGDANKPNDDTAFGLSGAFGVEVWFIPEFSAFVETGLFIDASNVDKSDTEFGTFTSAIGVNFNFDM